MLNCNEIELLLSELPLKDSVIQAITEHDFHSFTLSLFHKEEKAWYLYVELGTQTAHFCRTNVIIKPKAKKLQRFGQFFRANVIGSRIVEVSQVEGERFFTFHLMHNQIPSAIHFRFYSGPGANILITDGNNVITEAFMRRPQRQDSNGNLLMIPDARPDGKERFKVREYDTSLSFNKAIDLYYSEKSQNEGREEKLEQLKAMEAKAISALEVSLKNVEKRIESNEHFGTLKESGDLLSCYSYMIKKGDKELTVTDFNGNTVTLMLNEKLTPSENINEYYQKAQKSKKTYTLALEEKESIKQEIEKEKAKYKRIYELQDKKEQLKAIESLLKTNREVKLSNEATVGLRVTSHGFDIIVGRNAKENDIILRTMTRGSDLWLHTRDYPGGYVIIKSKKDKSIPLEVLLDAGNLAVHFSKAKDNGKADLYYTQCKYLRRAKDGKTGLVLPTQEKNLTITLDEKRIKLLI